MTNDAKEWVTVRIPKTTRDKARDDERTYEEIMQAGLDVGPSADMNVRASVTPELNEEKLDELVDRIETRLSTVDPNEADPIKDVNAGITEILDALDRIEDAATTAEERTGSIERTLEEFQ